MKRLLVALFVLLSPVLVGAVAIPAPVVTITANGVLVGDGSVRQTDAAGDVSFWEVAGGTATVGDGSVVVNPFSISYDPDPFINWSLSVKNFTTGDVTFIFNFAAPFVGGPWNAVSSEFSSTVTNEAGSGLLSAVTHESLVGSGTVLTTAMASCLEPGVLGCGSVTGAALLTPATPVSGTFGSRLGFTIGMRDSASVTGMTELSLAPAIPEPETYALMLLGLVAVSLVSRRRRTTATMMAPSPLRSRPPRGVQAAWERPGAA